MIETGVGWIPHFLEQMDDRYWRNRSWGNIPIERAAVVLLVSQHVRPRSSPTDNGIAQPPRGRRRQHDVAHRLPAPRQRLAVLAAR